MLLYAYSATERGIRERHQRAPACLPAPEPVSEPVAAPEPPAPAPDNVVRMVIPRTEARQIIADIAKEHGLTYADLVGPLRFRRIMPVRDEAIAAVRALSNGRELYSLPMMGRIFGGRDPTTILHALRRHAKRSK